MDKNQLVRQSLLKQRWNLDPNDKTAMDHSIYKKVITFVKSKKVNKYIVLYWPIENEVDTIAIIDELLANNYKVCLPFIKKNKMVFKPITTVHFQYSHWKNMKQPISETIINANDIQYMIVPVIGVNKSNKRLGYGLNFYNNYLHQHSGIYTIGLSYQFQRNNDFITTSFDKMLDTIITN